MISLRRCLATSFLLLLWMHVSLVRAEPAESLDWNSWRHLPVQDGGRPKPLDTLAREKLRALSNRLRAVDPATGQRLDACALYLAMVFDWHGWDRVEQPVVSSGLGSRQIPDPDKWDRMALLRVVFPPLRSLLGLKAEQKHISPLELSQSKLRHPDDGEDTPLLIWTARLASRAPEGLTPLEQEALDLALKFRAYQDLRAGRQLLLVPSPVPTDLVPTGYGWLSLSEIMGTRWDDASDTTGGLRVLQRQFREARTAYLNGSAAAFRQAAAEMRRTAAQWGPQWGVYPASEQIDWEIAWNDWGPFRCAWILFLCAWGILLLAICTKRQRLYQAGWIAFAAGLLAVLVGFGLRVAILRRPPVSNMFESVMFVAVGVAMLGFGLELIHRQKYLLAVAAAIATLVMLMAETSPDVWDSSLQPLPPILRSNFWLVAHAVTITLGFAALALAWGTANITLGQSLTASDNPSVIETLTPITHRSLSVGVLLLTFGTVFGCCWADVAWGRFWGWDPKEVWALITLLAYLAVLRAYVIGQLKDFGLAVGSVSCFALVVIAWYGVNVVLGVGRHDYGFSTGGEKVVLLGVAGQLLFVAVATGRYCRFCAEAKRRRECAANLSGGFPAPLR